MTENNIPVRVAVTGATGRMGKEIVRCIIETVINQKNEKYDKNIILGAVIARTGSEICGMDAGTIVHSNNTGVIISDDLYVIKDDFDVLIDFTTPDISMEYLKFCVDNNKNIVIGTTGFGADHYSIMRDSSRKIGIVYSANFSIGMNIMLKLLNMITQVIGNTADINIVEIHHNKKIDIPSGTALMMQDVIIKTLSSFVCNHDMLFSNGEDSSIRDNKLCRALSSSSLVSIHSIRAGDVIGEHSALFSSIGENIKITHQACSRAIFVAGALRAATWLKSKIGLFNMWNVLGI